uniref:Uncharacterized protein n=1 Tax=Sinorhizobium meliloti (strain SM11) TaxID=707241 RepID=Q1WLD3_SINMM|nr:hypothetical protein [Sinorhizobium meliloti]
MLATGDLKRINANIISVAHAIMAESGLLVESRLRYAGSNRPVYFLRSA